jgi:hypothetical protein
MRVSEDTSGMSKTGSGTGKKHLFKFRIDEDLAKVLRVRAAKAGRSYTAEAERAFRAYYRKFKP